jgi:ATP-dependent RNA helicase RhlE
VNPAEEYHFERIEDMIRMNVEELSIPESVEVPPTPFEEKQEYARELDRLKQRENPDYKGAFHEKKAQPKVNIGKGEKVKAKKQGKKPNRNQLKTKNQKNKGK